ncbi:MAG: c-type cytochrome [Pseudomonadota bacterium]
MARAAPLIAAVLLAAAPALASEWTEAEVASVAAEAGLDPAALLLPGDSDYGAYLAGECTACHQASGSYDGIPVITGWDPVPFKLAMHEYRSGARAHPVMSMIAAGLGDEEIAALAAYFATLDD